MQFNQKSNPWAQPYQPEEGGNPYNPENPDSDTKSNGSKLLDRAVIDVILDCNSRLQLIPNRTQAVDTTTKVLLRYASLILKLTHRIIHILLKTAHSIRRSIYIRTHHAATQQSSQKVTQKVTQRVTIVDTDPIFDTSVICATSVSFGDFAPRHWIYQLLRPSCAFRTSGGTLQ